MKKKKAKEENVKAYEKQEIYVLVSINKILSFVQKFVGIFLLFLHDISAVVP